jgi:hypothetical protein
VAVFGAQRALAPAAAPPFWHAPTARAAAPLTALYLGNVVLSLLSLKGLNLPVYLVLRRNTPLLVSASRRGCAPGGTPGEGAGGRRAAGSRAGARAATARRSSRAAPPALCSVPAPLFRLFTRLPLTRRGAPGPSPPPLY